MVFRIAVEGHKYLGAMCYPLLRCDDERRQTTNDTPFNSGLFIIVSFNLLLGLQLCEKNYKDNFK
jgi:hypothetical protein